MTFYIFSNMSGFFWTCQKWGEVTRLIITEVGIQLVSHHVVSNISSFSTQDSQMINTKE